MSPNTAAARTWLAALRLPLLVLMRSICTSPLLVVVLLLLAGADAGAAATVTVVLAVAAAPSPWGAAAATMPRRAQRPRAASAAGARGTLLPPDAPPPMGRLLLPLIACECARRCILTGYCGLCWTVHGTIVGDLSFRDLACVGRQLNGCTPH